MLDWRTNPNLILPTNIRICPSTVYSDAGFNIPGVKTIVVDGQDGHDSQDSQDSQDGQHGQHAHHSGQDGSTWPGWSI